MPHIVKRERIEDIQVGEEVRVTGFIGTRTVEAVHLPEHLIIQDEDAQAISVDFRFYVESEIYSPDDDGHTDAWAECEQHYGINHLGSADPCPLRQLAFAILKGEPMALDAARDILRC